MEPVLKGERDTISLLKATLLSILSRGQIYPGSAWFLLLPPRDSILFWIAHIYDHGYQRLLQWLSSVHFQRERERRYTEIQREVRSPIIWFGTRKKNNLWNWRKILNFERKSFDYKSLVFLSFKSLRLERHKKRLKIE